MELSIIIVNYNVKFFLEQCLHAVQKAISTIDAEIFVVDNHSSDHSVSYLKPLFPAVRFIENTRNIGFGAANNQALASSSGDYILFLNPDTLMPEDCLINCLSFIRSKADAGALGIRMLDGSGNFLPESKRAFPSPMAAFYKLIGLSAIFPQSARFNQYSLGHLNPLHNHRVDVLAGAFMLVSKPVLNITGSFDERFFMYAEDIDLSYRIQRAGFSNYYFSGSCILHFKGESTRKGSLNYVLLFYNAMRVFVQKNYRGTRAGIFSLFIQVAIFFRGFFSVLDKIFLYPMKKIFLKWTLSSRSEGPLVVISDQKAYESLIRFYKQAGLKIPEMQLILPENAADLLQHQQVGSILFCESDQHNWKQIILELEQLKYSGALFRFHASNSNCIIGSDSKETSGEALAGKK